MVIMLLTENDLKQTGMFNAICVGTYNKHARMYSRTHKHTH